MSIKPTAEKAVEELTLWETVATTRWGSYTSEVERRVILLGQELAGNPSEALEMGCEGGRWSKLLADRGWKMTCADINPDTLARCQKKIPAAHCILTDPASEKIPCDANAFSLLLCIEVAPLIHSTWFLSEVARVLRDKGIFVGMIWNKASARGVATNAISRSARGQRFYQQSYQNFRRKLISANFKIEYEEGFCWGPFRRASNSRLIPGFTRIERLLRLNRLISISPWVVFCCRKTDRS